MSDQNPYATVAYLRAAIWSAMSDLENGQGEVAYKALRKTHERSKPTAEPAVIPEAELVEMHLDRAGLSVELRHPIVPLMAEHLAAAFKTAGGVNYVTFEIDTEELGPLLLTMQRRWGETPERQARDRLAEIERLQSRLKEIEQADRTTAERMTWFFRQMWGVFLDGGSLDGPDLMETIEKSSLATWQPATAEQAEKAQCEVEEGDPLLVLTPEAHAAICAVKELSNAQ